MINFLKFNKKKEVNLIKMFGITSENLKKRKEYFEKTDYLHILMPEEDIRKTGLEIVDPYNKKSKKISHEEFIAKMCERFLVTPKQMTERLKFLGIIV